MWNDDTKSTTLNLLKLVTEFARQLSVPNRASVIQFWADEIGVDRS